MWVLEHGVCFERKRARKRCGVCVGVGKGGVWCCVGLGTRGVCFEPCNTVLVP